MGLQRRALGPRVVTRERRRLELRAQRLHLAPPCDGLRLHRLPPLGRRAELPLELSVHLGAHRLRRLVCPLRLASRRGVDRLPALALGGMQLPTQARHLVLRRRRHRGRRDVRGLVALRLHVGGALRGVGALTHRAAAAAAAGEEGRARLLALGPRGLELQLRAGQCAAELHGLRLRRRHAAAVAAERAAQRGGARLVEALAQPLDLAFDLVNLRRLRNQWRRGLATRAATHRAAQSRDLGAETRDLGLRRHRACRLRRGGPPRLLHSRVGAEAGARAGAVARAGAEAGAWGLR